jgi:hypothetical protein
MLIAKYEHTHLQKSRTINDGGLVALCQEVGGVFSGLFGVSATLPSLKAQAPHTSLVHLKSPHSYSTPGWVWRIENFKSDLDCEFLTSFYYFFLVVLEIIIDTNMLRCHYRLNILKHQCFINEIVLSFHHVCKFRKKMQIMSVCTVWEPHPGLIGIELVWHCWSCSIHTIYVKTLINLQP